VVGLSILAGLLVSFPEGVKFLMPTFHGLSLTQSHIQGGEKKKKKKKKHRGP
jgi:hypothetical protein